MSDSGGRSWLRSLESDPGALRDDAELLERLSALLIAALPRDQLEPLAVRAWSELLGVELVEVVRKPFFVPAPAGLIEGLAGPPQVRVSLAIYDESAITSVNTIRLLSSVPNALNRSTWSGSLGPTEVVTIGSAAESLGLPTQDDVDELQAAVERSTNVGEHWIEVELQDGSHVEVEDWPTVLESHPDGDDEEFAWDRIPERLAAVLVADLAAAAEFDAVDRATRRAEAGWAQ